MDTRPPPPGAPRFAFGRVYRTNLRPVIIGVGIVSALWSLLSGIGFFRSISTDKQEGVPKLATFAIVLGAVYMAMFLIETFGVIAATMQRLAFVRLYAMLSLVAIGLTIGGGIFQVIIHFTSKADIIKECTNLTNGEAVYPFGFFGPSRNGNLNTDPVDWCNSAYDRGSWSEIVSLLITIFLSCSFSLLAWGYYRQVLDPTSVANALRAPSNRINLYPTHYNPTYDASVPNLGYGYNAPYAGAPYAGAPYAGGQTYAPPPGAPPTTRDAPFAPPVGKPPGLVGGDGSVGYGQDDKENPFADFDERTERDVTSRPAPGGRDTFR